LFKIFDCFLEVCEFIEGEILEELGDGGLINGRLERVKRMVGGKNGGGLGMPLHDIIRSAVERYAKVGDVVHVDTPYLAIVKAPGGIVGEATFNHECKRFFDAAQLEDGMEVDV
jgi:hypothetical protein